MKNFPVKKVGGSVKLTSFWRGPYNMFGKCSELNYKVDGRLWTKG